MSISYDTETFGVEIVDKVAYVTALKDSSDYHGLAKGNDFMGSEEECRAYIESKGVTKIYGFKDK